VSSDHWNIMPARTSIETFTPNDLVMSGMTRALHAMNWSDRMEDAGCDLRAREITDYCGSVSTAARRSATGLHDVYCAANQVWNAQVLQRRAVTAGGDDIPQDFGWYLGMMGLGVGVSWFDNQPEFPLVVPHWEFCEPCVPPDWLVREQDWYDPLDWLPVEHIRNVCQRVLPYISMDGSESRAWCIGQLFAELADMQAVREAIQGKTKAPQRPATIDPELPRLT